MKKLVAVAIALIATSAFAQTSYPSVQFGTGAPAPSQATPVCVKDAAGNCALPIMDSGGRVFVSFEHPNRFSCGVMNQAASLLECKALTAGRTYVVTDIVAQSTTATAGDFAIQSGTGANCGSATATVFPPPPMTTAARFKAPPNTGAPMLVSLTTPLVVTAAHAICVIGMATNTLNIVISGYYTP